MSISRFLSKRGPYRMSERVKHSDTDDEGVTDRRGGWQIDRRVPVALIFALVVQFAVAVGWCSRIESREEIDATQITGLIAWKEIQGGTQTKTESRLAVIEEKLGEQSETLHHIDDRLEKMLTPPASK